MPKKIVIESCDDCPNMSTGGGLGQIAYIPGCDAMNGRTLPYTKSVSGNQIVATVTDQIPDWCPLEDD